LFIMLLIHLSRLTTSNGQRYISPYNVPIVNSNRPYNSFFCQISHLIVELRQFSRVRFPVLPGVWRHTPSSKEVLLQYCCILRPSNYNYRGYHARVNNIVWIWHYGALWLQPGCSMYYSVILLFSIEAFINFTCNCFHLELVLNVTVCIIHRNSVQIHNCLLVVPLDWILFKEF